MSEAEKATADREALEDRQRTEKREAVIQELVSHLREMSNEGLAFIAEQAQMFNKDMADEAPGPDDDADDDADPVDVAIGTEIGVTMAQWIADNVGPKDPGHAIARATAGLRRRAASCLAIAEALEGTELE